MDNEKEAANATGTVAAENLGEGDMQHGRSLEEESKTEEDVIQERLNETVGISSSSDQLQTPPEDDHDLIIKDVSNVNEGQHGIATGSDSEVQQIEAGEEAVPQKGTIATIPPANNNNTDQEDSAAFDTADEDDSSVVVPGFMFIPGPDYTGTGIYTGYTSDPEDNDSIQETGVIFQGFLPEDDPSRRSSRAESAEERVQRLIDNAITLDDSAVKPIPMEEDGDYEEGNTGLNNAARRHLNNIAEENDEVVKAESRRLLTLWVLLIAACISLVIALPLTLNKRKKSGSNTAQDTAGASFNDAVCLPGRVDARFAHAKSILSNITSTDLLDDEITPQGKAIRWIVCNDSISVDLLENPDSTGKLPKQKYIFQYSGGEGETQVTRRYILAVLFYSTSISRPWADSLNFLSQDLHECGWYRNYTRQNFPFGDYDPVGIFCLDRNMTFAIGLPDEDESPLDDGEYYFEHLVLNIRIDNDMNGVLPAEIGFLVDCKTLALENHVRLAGQLPHTIGNMTYLHSLSLLLNGPNFGGELPSELFQLKHLYFITIQDNLGKSWSLPSSDVQIGNDTQLERLLLVRNSFTGTIPQWITKLTRLQTLDLSLNNFQGAIPSAIGDLSSVKYLNLMGNNLTDSIPSSVGDLSQIEVLILGKNALQGGLPASIGNLRTLQLLDVGSNEITSSIPSSFEGLESLKYLVLESNRLNGNVDVLDSMKKLAVLLIRSNEFRGTLPDGLFSETSDDVVVDIGDNRFRDELPSSFASMSNLVSLLGTKNSFIDNAVPTDICDNTTLLVMDCDSCECCEVCCDGENDAICDFQLDVHTILGYDCGAWFSYCLQGSDYYAGVLY